jgi:hypothetical protein
VMDRETVGLHDPVCNIVANCAFYRSTTRRSRPLPRARRRFSSPGL